LGAAARLCIPWYGVVKVGIVFRGVAARRSANQQQDECKDKLTEKLPLGRRAGFGRRLRVVATDGSQVIRFYTVCWPQSVGLIIGTGPGRETKGQRVQAERLAMQKWVTKLDRFRPSHSCRDSSLRDLGGARFSFFRALSGVKRWRSRGKDDVVSALSVRYEAKRSEARRSTGDPVVVVENEVLW
jgi:hypothetical protein